LYLKKLDENRKAWLIRRNLSRFHRKSRLGKKSIFIKHVVYEHAPERKNLDTPIKFGKIYSNGVTRNVKIRAYPNPVPRVLSLTDNWDATVSFLRDVRQKLSKNIENKEMRPELNFSRRTRRSGTLNIDSYHDFSSLESITIPVALILASEYDRSRKLVNWAPFAINIHEWNPKVRQMLDDIGFLQLSGVDGPEYDIIATGNSKLLRLRCGDTVDGAAIGAYFDALGVNLLEEDSRLYVAIMEAVNNIIHHAYKNDELIEPNSVKNWWLAAEIKQDNLSSRLRIVVYDQGATIPRTLPTWERYPVWKAVFKTLMNTVRGTAIDLEPDNPDYDGDAIRIAMEIGRSSTDQSHRGKGLAQIVSPLDYCHSGAVAIYSRQGEFRQKKGEVSVSVNRNIPMIGTLVYWDLELRR
jgi:IS1 family transposase